VRYPKGDELPEALEQAHRRAIRLELISLVYWLSAIVAIYFTLGQSQAMKAAWVEDILALFPPIAFLVASRFRHREPTARFPWGYHRSITVAYTVSSLALLALGAFILIDSVHRLLEGTHPPIGMVEVFDAQIWLGWLMLVALAYSGIPPLILGRLKQPLSAELHDKVLFADATMNRADWLTASAAAVGVVGIGFGLWWADGAAAIVISLAIVHDGQKYLRESVADLMDDAPKRHDEGSPHPLIERIKDEVAAAAWVREAAVRLREHGHLITGDVWVVPRGEEDLVDRVEELTRRIDDLDWKLHGVIVSPVSSIEDPPEEIVVGGGVASDSDG
jgi:cation diffusion facilitator family transporter